MVGRCDHEGPSVGETLSVETAPVETASVETASVIGRTRRRLDEATAARRTRGTERRSRQRRSRQRQSRQRRSSVETASVIGRASIQFETPLPVHRASGADAFLRDQDVCRAVGPKRSGGVQIGVIDAGRLQRGGRQVAADRLKRTGGGTEEVRRSAVWRTLAAEVVWTAAGPGWSGGGDLAAAGRLRP